MPAGQHLMDFLKFGLPFNANQMLFIGAKNAVTLNLKYTEDGQFEIAVFWHRKPNATQFTCSVTREMLLQKPE